MLGTSSFRNFNSHRLWLLSRNSVDTSWEGDLTNVIAEADAILVLIFHVYFLSLSVGSIWDFWFKAWMVGSCETWCLDWYRGVKVEGMVSLQNLLRHISNCCKYLNLIDRALFGGMLPTLILIRSFCSELISEYAAMLPFLMFSLYSFFASSFSLIFPLMILPSISASKS